MRRELEAAAGLLTALLIIAGTAVAHVHVGTAHRDLLGKGILQPSSRACGLHVDVQAHNALMAKVEAAVYGTHLQALNSSDNVRAAVLASRWPAGGIAVPIQFHIIQWQGSSSVMDTTSPQVNTAALGRQLAVLNRDYKAVGISFLMAGAPMFHSNQDWTANCEANLNQIISMVVTSPATTLNIVLCDLYSQGGLLGVTPVMPGSVPQTAKAAVVVDYRTLPGGPFLRFSGGRSLTHEVGHYFGLLHPFGSCQVDNDGIPDTPMELSGASGCPVGRDSCPSNPGLDPIWSFMDYSDDACMTHFSPGQRARMQATVLQLRPKLLAAARRLSLKRVKKG